MTKIIKQKLRPWDLEINIDKQSGCIEIKEDHREGEHKPYVVIAEESIDEVIKQLMLMKSKM